MKNRIVCFVLIVAIIALAIPVYAIIPGEDTVPAEQASYYGYDFDTNETTLYEIPINTTSTETWSFFTEREVAQMTSAAYVGVSPNDIIGSDNLTITPPSSSPYNAVVNIIVHIDSNENGVYDRIVEGTGFLVNDKVVVTAAHLLIPELRSGDLGRDIVEIKVYYGVHSDSLSGSSIVADSYYWPTGFTSQDDTISDRFDFAVIELESSIQRPFYFNCIVATNSIVNSSINISGYPFDNTLGYEGYYQYSSTGRLFEMDSYNLRYSNDTLSGMSGSPIYNSSYTACYGVHNRAHSASGRNQGVWFHSTLYTILAARLEATQ